MAEEKVIEHLQMLLNLGEWGTTTSVIGFADVYRDPETRTSRIEIKLGEKGSEILDHLREIAELKAIGFAGIMRRPENGG